MLTLLCAVFSSAWGQTTIASGTFNGKNGVYTQGWTYMGEPTTEQKRDDCVLVYEGENVTSPTVNLTGYDKIKIQIKSRRYGNLSNSQAIIDAAIGGTSVGTTIASNTSATTELAPIEFVPTSDMTAVQIVFTCTNATSAAGAGINSITIVGLKNNDVATPVFSLTEGTYTEEQSVAITCETEGADIYYTIDGNDPSANSTEYSQAITISETTTLKAIAIKDGVSSGIASATYTIVGEEVVEDGIFDFTQNLTYGSGLTPSGSNTYIEEPHTWTAGNVTLVTDGKYRYWERSGNNQLRIGYSTSTLTFSVPEGKVITQVVFTSGKFTLTTEQGSLSNKTWTGKANTVLFTTSGGNSEIETITVTYGDDDGELLDPQLSIEDVSLYDDTETLEITTLSDGEITFTYDPEGVVEITYDEATHKYIVSRCEDVYEGSTTVTAEQAGTDSYDSATTTFEVTVFKKSPNVTLDEQYIGEIGNINMTVNTSKDLDFYTEAASGFSFTSSDESIATVEMNETNDVLTINAVGVGTATITYTGEESMVFEPVELTFTVTVKEEVVGLNGWILTDIADLAPGDVFVIVGANATGSFAMANDKGASDAPTAVAVTLSDDKSKLTSDVADNIRWNISGNSSGYTFYPDGNTAAWLYSTKDNNGMRVGTGDAKLFTLSTEGYLTVTVNNVLRYVGIYSSQDWRSYTSINNNIKNQEFAFYKKYGEEILVPTITTAINGLTVDADGDDGTITVTYKNFVEDPEPSVKFYEADGVTELETAPDWITIEFDAENNLVYSIEANTGEARTAYLKVYASDSESGADIFSGLITINQAGYVADYAKIPFEFDGDNDDIKTTTGLTQNGLGKYSSSPKLKFDGTGDWMILKLEEHAQTALSLSFDIKGNPAAGNTVATGTFNVMISADGETYTELATYTELSDTQSEAFDLPADIRYIKWIYTTKTSGNVGLGNIVVIAPEEIVVTFNKRAEGYSTLYYGTKNLIIPNGVKASTYKVGDDGKYVETEYESIIPKGSAVVIELEDKSLIANGNKDVTFTTTAATETAHTDNMLYGFDEDDQWTVGPDETKEYLFYSLSLNAARDEGSIGFYWNNKDGNDNGGQFKIPAHRAYLAVEKETANGVSAFAFDGIGTGINGIFANGLPADGVYTLSGVRVNSDSLQKGIYIVNGKKVVIK